MEQSRNGVAPSPTLRCSSYWKGSLRVNLDKGPQLYFYKQDLALNNLQGLICHKTQALVGEICLSMIIQGHFRQESLWKKFWILAGLFSSTPSTLFPKPCTEKFPSCSFGINWPQWQKIFLRRLGEILCEKLLKLKTSWILLARNQQANG